MASPPSESHTTAIVAHALARPLGARSIVPADRAPSVSLCEPSADPQHASCMSTIRMSAKRDATVLSDIVDGLTPDDLASIYGYGAQGGTSGVVGIVVAYDYASAESDLAAYRAKYGLPACTTANGCFKKVGAAASAIVTAATGGATSVSAHPTTSSSGWAAEADADTQVVSAVCHNCKIVLAEAASDKLSDLGAAVQAAIGAGATIVNASFGAPESSSQKSLEPAFEPAPVKVVASAGDSGPAAMFPASASNVIAVSGTTLNIVGDHLVSESMWSGSGGGCSTVFARASYQSMTCGTRRSVADIAVVADPADGVSFYDSGIGGWAMIGGTSIAAPIVASMFALSGDTVFGAGAQQLYTHHPFNYLPVLGSSSKLAGNGAPLSLAAF